MVVGVLRLDIRLYQVQSLKQKRSLIRKLIARLRSKYPISLLEAGYQDRLQRAMIGLSMTAGSESQLESVFHKVETEIYQSGLAEVLASDVEYLHYGDELT